MVIGDPLDRSTHHGPQNHKAHMNKLLSYCQAGVDEGATLVLGGKRVDRPGLFLEPTIFTNVSDEMMIAKEESFGPVMIISKFDDNDIDGVLKRANQTEFGLASGVFSRDVSKVMKIAEKLDAGTVFINCYNKTDVAAPFGGFKQSGFGKDLAAVHQKNTIACFDMQYHERLAVLELETLELRRLLMDLKMINKILYNLVDLNVSDFFDLSAHPSTRTHTE